MAMLDAEQQHAVPSGRPPIARSLVRLPLEVGTLLDCRWRDGNFYPARIIERRRKPDGAEDEYEYYVHYRKCEFLITMGRAALKACSASQSAAQRCWQAALPDVFCQAQREALAAVITPACCPLPAPAAVNRRMDEWVELGNFNLDTVVPPEPEPAGDGRTRGQKRKVDEDHSEEEGEGHEDFDPQQLREHEEFTKVKNIEKIELGRFEMETWYFSPFPIEFRDCKVCGGGVSGGEVWCRLSECPQHTLALNSNPRHQLGVLALPAQIPPNWQPTGNPPPPPLAV